MSEDQFQKAVLQLAQLNGYEIRYHNPDSRRSQAGFPDLVLASQTRARFLLRELKTDTGRVSGIQKFTIGVLEACGIDVAVWRPADLRSGAILADLRGGRR
jgi:hypothetical protein